MWDKTFIILLVLALLIGIAAYDRYISDQGGVSPVSQLVDFVGVARFSDWKGSRIRVIRRHLQGDMEDRLARLADCHRAIAEKRNQLLVDREMILQRLGELDGQIQQEAGRYLATLDRERSNFAADFDEFEDIKRQLAQSAVLSQGGVGDETLARFHEQLTDLLTRVVDPDDGAGMAGPPVAEKITRLIEQSERQWPERCGAAGDCFSWEIDEIRRDIEGLTRNDTALAEQCLTELDGLIDLLAREAQLFRDNAQVSEERFQENQQRINGEFQQLTQRLFEITEEDARELMQLYEELWDEQQIWLDNLALNGQRLRSAHIRADRRVAQPLGGLALPSSAALKKFYSKTVMERHDLLDRFDKNAAFLRQEINGAWRETKSHAERLSQFAGGGKKMLDQKFPMINRREKIRIPRQRPTEPAGFIENSRQARAAGRPSPANTVSQTPAPPTRQSRANGTVWEDYQRVKDKARDQGFYDRNP